MKETMVTISLDRLCRLECDSKTLELLEDGGVDNWEWYGESLYSEGDYHEVMNEVEMSVLKEFGLEV